MSLPYLDLFDYDLPKSLIANDPLPRRDHSKLLIFDRDEQTISHRRFYELEDLLTNNDVLVLNQSKVFPSRLIGKKDSGGVVELLLIKPISNRKWKAIAKPGLTVGKRLIFDEGLTAVVRKVDPKTGEREVEFFGKDIAKLLSKIGKMPVPGYIKSSLKEEELRMRYQTVYAKDEGSVAAPTAGLHFTKELLDKLSRIGVQVEYVTLHVGLGTFQNVREDNLAQGQLHSEQYEIEADTVARLNTAKRQGKKIIAVGTTSTRTLESAVNKAGVLEKSRGDTTLFIRPLFQFKFVDAMITNFHIPRSSLLMLISAFTTSPNTREVFKDFKSSFIGRAYQEAVNLDYRFFSFGDAMFIQ